MKKYPIYFLDADQTLFDFKGAEAKAILETLVHEQLPQEDAVVKAYHELNDALWKALERGETTQQKLKVERFQQLFDFLGVKRNAEAAAEFYAAALAQKADLLPHAKEVCAALSKEADLYLTTNGISQIQRGRFEKSGLCPYFADICISEEIGFSKPDPRYFEVIRNRIGAGKEEVLVVGDSLSSDVKGALAAGLDVYWFNPAGLPLPEGITPTAVITSITELLEAKRSSGKILKEMTKNDGNFSAK